MKVHNIVQTFICTATYQITVEGNINDTNLPLIYGMSINKTSFNAKLLSTITGVVKDQAALNGLLTSLTDNRYTIVSVLKLC
ncbi:hypothetical protein [Saccharicrinis aurantiacus]|uniref:hypothetical protein n=1 Tax=Saccharicrinis aurantiacus TaxID=1849719 RepID=UPI0009502983|nr:hypothetical protein [Saccharicrinis aurantiacus]